MKRIESWKIFFAKKFTQCRSKQNARKKTLQQYQIKLYKNSQHLPTQPRKKKNENRSQSRKLPNYFQGQIQWLLDGLNVILPKLNTATWII